jgi:hypothetical protein
MSRASERIGGYRGFASIPDGQLAGSASGHDGVDQNHCMAAAPALDQCCAIGTMFARIDSQIAKTPDHQQACRVIASIGGAAADNLIIHS